MIIATPDFRYLIQIEPGIQHLIQTKPDIRKVDIRFFQVGT